jgi:hypothetical protein
VDFHQLRRLGVRLAQLDAGGEVDIRDFIGDAVRGIEPADVAEVGRGSADLFV